MSYLVFARKYRPQNFDEIVGQEHITTTLKNAILQNRIAHAYLFAGPRGIGKTSTARIFSKALNCEKGPTTTPCNKCDICKEISSGTSLDVLEIDGASNRGIEEIRNLRENVKFSPSRGKFKIYIIDEVHMLTTEAFNALLKTLEEPPPHVKFIFATTQPHKILPTILSRCQRFNFKRVSATDLVQVLKGIAGKEKIEAEEDALYAIAYASEGGLRDAESILDQLSSFSHGKVTSEDVHSVLGMVGQEVYFDIAQKIIDKDIAGCLNLVDELEKNGKDLSQFVLGLINHFRNLLVAKFGKDVASLLEMSGESINKLVQISKSVSQEDLLYISNVLINTHDIIRRTNSPRIPLEMSLVRLSRRANMASIDEALNKLSGIESRLSNSSQTIAGQECPATTRISKTSNELDCHGLRSLSADRQARNDVIASVAKQSQKGISYSIELSESDEKILAYIKGIWTDFLSKVREKKMSTATYLAEGEPVSIKANQLTIGIPAQFILHKEVLEDTGNRQLIETVLNDLSGSNIKINFTITNTQIRSEDKGPGVTSPVKLEEVLTAEPMVKKALELFEGKVLKVEN